MFYSVLSKHSTDNNIPLWLSEKNYFWAPVSWLWGFSQSLRLKEWDHGRPKRVKNSEKKTNSKFSWLPSIKFGWNVCEQNACWLLKCQKVFYGSCRNFGKKIKFNLDLLSKRVIWSTVMLFEAYFFYFFPKQARWNLTKILENHLWAYCESNHRHW